MDTSAQGDSSSPSTTTPTTAPVTPPSANPAPETPAVSTSPKPANPDPASTPASGTPPHKSSKILMIVLVILVIAVIIVGATYFIMLQNGKNTASSQLPTITKRPTVAPATPTPDTSNKGLQQSSDQINQQLSNLDNEATQATNALTQQAPNLQ